MGSYKIRELEQLTGIKAHTIRIWEKRYGILEPERSSTKIRKYSDEELMLLLNVSLLNKNGLKISKIAGMSSAEISEKVKTESNKKNTGIHENMLLALLHFDEKLFCDTLEYLIEQNGFEDTFWSHVIPFLERTGVMWMVGTIHPGQEHFISSLIRQKLIVEIDKLPVKNTKRKAILFLPEHEAHEFTLLFYNLVLRKSGYETYYFGQYLPMDSLAACIEKLRPDFLVTAWITGCDPAGIRTYFKDLSERFKVPVYAGGFQVKEQLEKLSSYLHFIDSPEVLKSL